MACTNTEALSNALRKVYSREYFMEWAGPVCARVCSYCGGLSRIDRLGQCRGCGAPETSR